MVYSQFCFDCVVDWVALEVWTLERHPAWRVWKKSAGAFSYVEGLDETTGEKIATTGAQRKNTPTRRFVVRIQNPARFSEVTSALDAIHDRESSSPVVIKGIEVAFDAYRASPNGTDAELIAMTATMLHRISRPANTNGAPRLYTWKGTSEQRYGWKHMIPAITAGKTGMFGNHDDNYVVRGYLKNYDTIQTDTQSKPERVDLETDEHRARVEVRLQGDECPVGTLEELKNFPFQSLARYFKFQRPGDAASALETLIRESEASLGKLLDANGVSTNRPRSKMLDADGTTARISRPRKTISKTQADELNEIARDQLRKLSLRWGREKGRVRRRGSGNSCSK